MSWKTRSHGDKTIQLLHPICLMEDSHNSQCMSITQRALKRSTQCMGPQLLSYGSGEAQMPTSQTMALLRAPAWRDGPQMHGVSKSPTESVWHSDNDSTGLGLGRGICILKWLDCVILMLVNSWLHFEKCYRQEGSRRANHMGKCSPCCVQ